MAKAHVKKGDAVTVITGKWKGEKATVLAVLKKNDRVVLEMTGLSDEKRKSLGKRTVRRSASGPGQLVDRSVSVHVSNVARAESR